MSIVIIGVITIKRGEKHDFLYFLQLSCMKTRGCKGGQMKFPLQSMKKKGHQWLPFVYIEMKTMCFFSLFIFYNWEMTRNMQF